MSAFLEKIKVFFGEVRRWLMNFLRNTEYGSTASEEWAYNLSWLVLLGDPKDVQRFSVRSQALGFMHASSMIYRDVPSFAYAHLVAEVDYLLRRRNTTPTISDLSDKMVDRCRAHNIELSDQVMAHAIRCAIESTDLVNRLVVQMRPLVSIRQGSRSNEDIYSAWKVAGELHVDPQRYFIAQEEQYLS